MDDVCVIIVSHNGKRWLDGALEHALSRARAVSTSTWSSSTTAATARPRTWRSAFRSARTISCANRGFGAANNVGLETADARYVLFLNPGHRIPRAAASRIWSPPSTAGPRSASPASARSAAAGRWRRASALSVDPEHAGRSPRDRAGPGAPALPRRARARPGRLRPRNALRLDLGLLHARPQRGPRGDRRLRRALLPLLRGDRSLLAPQAGRLGGRPPAAGDDPPLRERALGDPADGGAGAPTLACSSPASTSPGSLRTAWRWLFATPCVPGGEAGRAALEAVLKEEPPIAAPPPEPIQATIVSAPGAALSSTRSRSPM